ncbi:MAG: DUF973 family protein [Thermoplasmata archaeon]|nr:DUF973 family protein [Thermoplasmata archaeon]
MAGSGCPACGSPNPPGASFCYRCGQLLPSAAAYPPPPPPGFSGPVGGWTYPGSRPALSRDVDVPVLQRVQLAAIVSVVGGLLSAVLVFGGGALIGSFPIGVSGGAPLPSNSTLELLDFSAVAGLAVGLTSLVLMRSAFARLRPIDPGFATPTSLIPVAMAGLILLLVGLPFLFETLSPVIQCASMANNSTRVPTSCSAQLGPTLAAVGLVLIGAILALVGYIGLLLGLWRLGTRHDSALLKVGTILAILVPFVGYILLWLGCREALRRLTASPTMWRPGGMPPPG